jgi:hypothetical protein
MNYTASLIIKREMDLSSGKKWCALMGNTHTNNYHNVPGVAELTGVRSIYVIDPNTKIEFEKSIKDNEVKYNDKYTHTDNQSIQFKGDVILVRHPSLDISIFFEEKEKIETLISSLRESVHTNSWKKYFDKPNILNKDDKKQNAIFNLVAKVNAIKANPHITFTDAKKELLASILAVKDTAEKKQVHKFNFFSKSKEFQIKNSKVAIGLKEFLSSNNMVDEVNVIKPQRVRR